MAQLKRDQQFINEPAKQRVVGLRVAYQLNTNPRVSPNPLIQEGTSSTIVHSAITCSGCMFYRLFASLFFPLCIWCTSSGAYEIGPIPVHWWLIMVALTLAMALVTTLFFGLILFLVPAGWH